MTIGNVVDLMRMEMNPNVNIEEVIVIYRGQGKPRLLALGGERSGQVMRHQEFTKELEEAFKNVRRDV